MHKISHVSEIVPVAKGIKQWYSAQITSKDI